MQEMLNLPTGTSCRTQTSLQTREEVSHPKAAPQTHSLGSLPQPQPAPLPFLPLLFTSLRPPPQGWSHLAPFPPSKDVAPHALCPPGAFDVPLERSLGMDPSSHRLGGCLLAAPSSFLIFNPGNRAGTLWHFHFRLWLGMMCKACPGRRRHREPQHWLLHPLPLPCLGNNRDNGVAEDEEGAAASEAPQLQAAQPPPLAFSKASTVQMLKCNLILLPREPFDVPPPPPPKGMRNGAPSPPASCSKVTPLQRRLHASPAALAWPAMGHLLPRPLGEVRDPQPRSPH